MLSYIYNHKAINRGVSKNVFAPKMNNVVGAHDFVNH